MAGAFPLSAPLRHTALVHTNAGAISTLLVLVVAGSTVASSPDQAPILDWQEVSRRVHDSTAYTQGLVLDDAGRLFESTGRWGSSTVREVDAANGQVIRSEALPDEWFGEGLALVDGDLIGLTWRAGVAVRRDADTFALIDRYHYEGEGWGLCYDGERLVMSDGSHTLQFRDAHTFETIGSVDVTIDGELLEELNELECVDGSVWANVWRSDTIVRIDPADGRVTGVLDMRGLMEPHPAASDSDAVLNGIAWDATAGTLLVTGKYWPELIEIRVAEPRT